MQILTVSGLQKTYTTRFGGSKVQALKNVNFTVESGEYVAIMGESGSGKTTLLNILAALDKPTGGTVLLGGKNLSEIPEETAAAFRRDNLGFVFQDFSLLDTFSLEDNICLPLVLAGKSREWGVAEFFGSCLLGAVVMWLFAIVLLHNSPYAPVQKTAKISPGSGV